MCVSALKALHLSIDTQHTLEAFIITTKVLRSKIGIVRLWNLSLSYFIIIEMLVVLFRYMCCNPSVWQ